mgnify:CR=1 FL=1
MTSDRVPIFLNSFDKLWMSFRKPSKTVESRLNSRVLEHPQDSKGVLGDSLTVILPSLKGDESVGVILPVDLEGDR